MRKAINYALAFCLLVLVGDRLTSFVAGRVVARSQNSFVRMYEKRAKADVLLLGNSRMDRNCDVLDIREISGLTALNLGLGGNSTVLSEALFLDYLDRYGPPATLVIEVTQALDRPNSMGEMMIFTGSSSRMRQLAAKVDPTYVRFERVFPSLRYNCDTFWRLAAEGFSNAQSRKLTKSIAAEEKDRWHKEAQLNWPVVPENLNALERIIAEAQRSGVEVRLVIAPIWRDLKSKIANYDTWKAEVARHTGKLPIHDYSDLFVSDEGCFNDSNHLNGAGARKFVETMHHDGLLSSRPAVAVAATVK